MRVFLRFNGVSAPPPVFIAGPFVKGAAQDSIDVPDIAKRLSAWFPLS
jgi:death on curing protein